MYRLEWEFDKYIVATVDPGVTTAIVIWDHGSHIYSNIAKGDLHVIAGNFARILNYHKVQKVIIEAMDVRTSSAVSLCAGVKGDLSKLAYIIGALQYVSKNITMVTYAQWAGQLTYKQLRNILRIKFKFDAKNDHIAAAYGIGLWGKGLL